MRCVQGYNTPVHAVGRGRRRLQCRRPRIAAT
jgi:hypothetical protein